MVNKHCRRDGHEKVTRISSRPTTKDHDPVVALLTVSLTRPLNDYGDGAAHNQGCSMADRDHDLCWRVFNLNWLPVAAMGCVLLLAVALTRFSIEPLAFGIVMAIGVMLAAVAYLHVRLKGDQVDPKLVFMLGAVAQV